MTHISSFSPHFLQSPAIFILLVAGRWKFLRISFLFFLSLSILQLWYTNLPLRTHSHMKTMPFKRGNLVPVPVHLYSSDFYPMGKRCRSETELMMTSNGSRSFIGKNAENGMPESSPPLMSGKSSRSYRLRSEWIWFRYFFPSVVTCMEKNDIFAHSFWGRIWVQFPHLSGSCFRIRIPYRYVETNLQIPKSNRYIHT